MRNRRVKHEGAIYHVTARINRQELILEAEQFKEILLNIILRAKRKYPFLFRNFCIMGNHVHLEIEPIGESDISKIMQWILSVFAKNYNDIYKYKGHVWYDRFKSKVINSLIQYIRTFFYIANNPVRAGIVNDTLAFKYSGITCHFGNNGPNPLDPLYLWMKPLLQDFLEKYAPASNCQVDLEYSFVSRKPGRPRKK